MNHFIFRNNRQNDPRLGRWLSIDPKAASFPGVSPYVSMGNNPKMMLDPEGDFVIAKKGEKSKVNSWVQKRDIAQEGFSLMPILKNIRTYVEKNPHMLDVLIKFTGQTRETILSDLEFGEGPKIFTGPLPYHEALTSFGEIMVADRHLDYIKIVERINSDDAEAAKLMLVSTFLHELGHYYGLDDKGPNSTYQMEKELWKKEDDSNFSPSNVNSFDNLIKNEEAMPFEAEKVRKRMKIIMTKKVMNLVVATSLFLINVFFFLLIITHESDTCSKNKSKIKYIEQKKELEILKIIINNNDYLFTKHIIYFQTPAIYEESVITLNDYHIVFRAYLVEIPSNSVKIIGYYSVKNITIIKYLINNKFLGLIVIDDKGDALGNVIME